MRPLWLLALVALTSSAEPLATWDGGAIAATEFADSGAWTSERQVRDALAATLFEAIYLPIAEQEDLAADPVLGAQLAAQRRQLLAEAFLDTWTFDEIPDDAALRAYQQRHAARYGEPERVSIAVVHESCTQDCPEPAALDADGVQALAAERSRTHGGGNGVFADIAVNELAGPLREVLKDAEIGDVRQTRTRLGVFTAVILARSEAQLRPLGNVRDKLLEDYRHETFRVWQIEVIAAYRRRFDHDGTLDETEIFARKATLQKLHETPAFKNAEQRQRASLLTQAAFQRDQRVWPDTNQLTAYGERQATASQRLDLQVIELRAERYDDPHELLFTARRLLDGLNAGTVQPSAPTVDARTFSAVRRGALNALKAPLAATEDDRWSGPFSLTQDARVDVGGIEQVIFRPGALLIRTSQRRPPTTSELRGDYLRAMSRRVNRWRGFKRSLVPRWNVVIDESQLAGIIPD